MSRQPVLKFTPIGAKIPPGRIGNFELRYLPHLPHPYSIRTHNKYTVELTERGAVWMSNIEPEMKIIRDIVKKCEGRVLVGGLGLGIVTEELAKKDSVTGIVVVEIAQEVIDLVWKYLDTRGKGAIVKDDLFHYLEVTTEKFDYLYFDIHNDSASPTIYGDLFLPLRAMAEKKFPSERIFMAEEDVVKKNWSGSR